MSLPLSGVGVLVTRPAGQAAGLTRRIREFGGDPLPFPALAILPPRDPAALADSIDRLDDFQLAIFVSPTAVEEGLAAVKARRDWPPSLSVAAVGKGSGEALAQAGFDSVLAPESGADSEHLLAQPQLRDMTGKRVVIFRGEGGRELLADTLVQRGAKVTQADCYRRALPESDPGPVLAAFAANRLQAVTVFSAQTLDNLLQLLGPAGKAYLAATPLFAPHPRIAQHAQGLGIAHAIATGPGESGVIRGLVEYFAHA